MNYSLDVSEKEILEILHLVKDPEIPVLSVVDMGVVRGVALTDPLTITITPTYSGCPAMNTIEADIKDQLANNGFANTKILTVLSPPWTTEWLTDRGRNQLEEYGITPPQGSTSKRSLFLEDETIPCPRCKSSNTQLVSEFGSTACKAHYKCKECLEPFDYFKCI